jgi:leucyl-tRNA synthetase
MKIETEQINFTEIDKKHQEKWYSKNIFKTPALPEKPKFYCLDMFPYPSGEGLHVGHPEGYTASDIICRYKRMNGFDVLHPMGWDAFGLPAENYAISTGIHPSVITKKNIENFKRQIKSIGFSYDWDREINTTDPNYYKWTQWIFLQLYNKGLAYEEEVPINWCPSCKTGLANEEVFQGKCERCQTKIEKKNIRQWMLKITAYADRLLEDLNEVDWPKSTIEMQKNWIGKKEGAEIEFKIENTKEKLKIFTTRPDTIYGVTYMVLAPEHPIISKITTPENKEKVDSYIKAAAIETEMERTDETKEKTGVFTGAYAINPINNQKVPIWISDYVLLNYGTGAIMAVPAHDERDWEFAKKFNLPIIYVVKPKSGVIDDNLPFCEEGISFNSPLINGIESQKAKEKITNILKEKGIGEKKINYKLRDWVFSRQRYWGEPIPIVHCEKCGAVPLDYKDLPLLLPEMEKYQPSGTGESPLAKLDKWLNTKCPKCDGKAKRETNTMPQWAGSCWYYLRYIDNKNDGALVDPIKEKAWMPVDLYIGGSEHAVLHLLYARFWHKVLYDLGYVSTKEPFKKLVHQGMILSYSYRDKNGVYHPYSELDIKDDGTAITKTGEEIKPVVEKMSKSKKNVINPDEIINKYGADSFRMYEMFMGPLEDSKPWDMHGIEGINRFLKRFYNWALNSISNIQEKENSQELKILRHETIMKVSKDIEALKFNTAISFLMVYLNELSKHEKTFKGDFEAIVKLLHPFAPHITDEIWEKYSKGQSVLLEKWPEYSSEILSLKKMEIPVQINGKVKIKLMVSKDIKKEELEKLAIEQSAKFIGDKKISKIIYVENRLISIVLKD